MSDQMSRLLGVGVRSFGLSVLVACSGCVPWDAPEQEVTFTSLESAQAAGAEVQSLSFFDHNPAITNFPTGVYQLTSLRKLSVRGNPCSLPDGISALESLNWLDLGEMQLRSLPADLGQLSSLKVLYLTDNSLTALPDEFGSLSSLEYVNLDRNALTTLPEGPLGYCP